MIELLYFVLELKKEIDAQPRIFRVLWVLVRNPLSSHFPTSEIVKPEGLSFYSQYLEA